MIKKVLLGSLAAGLLATFVLGKEVVSYVKTCSSSISTAVKSEVPLDFEVQRARDMVDNLVPDINHCMQMIAEQQVEIDYLSAEIASKEEALSDQRAAILALREELGSGKSTFRFASRTYTPIEVKRDLERRFERFKAAEESVARDRQILDARRQAVAANQDKLTKMLNKKKELEVDLAQLEARLKTVQAAETVSNLEIDDSQLSQAKTLIGNLNRQLDVRERMLDAEGKFTNLIPIEVEADDSDDVTAEIDAYFQPASDSKDVAEEIELEPAA